MGSLRAELVAMLPVTVRLNLAGLRCAHAAMTEPGARPRGRAGREHDRATRKVGQALERAEARARKAARR